MKTDNRKSKKLEDFLSKLIAEMGEGYTYTILPETTTTGITWTTQKEPITLEPEQDALLFNNETGDYFMLDDTDDQTTPEPIIIATPKAVQNSPKELTRAQKARLDLTELKKRKKEEANQD